jgi:hypothetical protein
MAVRSPDQAWNGSLAKRPFFNRYGVFKHPTISADCFKVVCEAPQLRDNFHSLQPKPHVSYRITHRKQISRLELANKNQSIWTLIFYFWTK